MASSSDGIPEAAAEHINVSISWRRNVLIVMEFENEGQFLAGVLWIGTVSLGEGISLAQIFGSGMICDNKIK